MRVAGGNPTNKLHASPTYAATAVTVTTLAVTLALALIVAPSAQSGGSSGPDCLLTNTGGELNDSLCGTAGADVMTGGAGNDKMFGRGGNDTMSGDSGEDVVRGESGNDILLGGSGYDTLIGSSGNDQLRFRDAEVDAIFASSCGDGADSISMDLVDFAAVGFTAFGSCETVTIGAVNEGPNVVISRDTPKIKDNGEVPVRLSCPAELTVPCTGTLRVGRSANSQGPPKAYSIQPGATDKVSARLSRRDRRKLSRNDELTALAISVEGGEFGDKTTVQTLGLKGKRHT